MNLKTFAATVRNFFGAPAQSGLPTQRQNWLGPRFEPSNISSYATIQSVQAAIREGENGDPTSLFRFYRDALLGDDHIQGEFNKRKLAVIGQPLAILPADKTSEDDARAAAACLRAIHDCENWNPGLANLLGSSQWPVTLAENIFRPADPFPVSYSPPTKNSTLSNNNFPLQYTLKRLEPVNPLLFCFRHAYLVGGVGMGSSTPVQQAGITPITPSNPSSSWYSIDLTDWEPFLRLWPIDDQGRIIYDASRASKLDTDRHIVHRGHLLTDQRDNWGGPMRAMMAWWLLRGLGRDWFAGFMERYRWPIPVAKTNVQDPESVALLQQAFQTCVKLGGLVIGQDDEINFEEAQVQGGAEGHKIWHDTCNNAISRHITGYDSTSKPAGLNAGESQGQENIRADIRIFDGKTLAETLEKQLFPRFLKFNALPGQIRVQIGGLSPSDATAFATLLKTASDSGWEPTDASIPVINEKLGIEMQRKAVAQDPGKTEEDPESSAFDPNSDIVTQRSLWREKHKAELEKTVQLSAGGDFITIDGHPVFIGDKKKGSTSGDKTGKLKGENDSKSDHSQRSGDAKGSLESAAHDTSGDARTVPGHDATLAERGARISAEEGRLRNWAEENGKLGGKLPREDHRGGEHTVQIPHEDDKPQRVVKATRPDAQKGYGVALGSNSTGASPGEYLDRLATHNRVFDDDVRLERIVPKGGKLSIVTSQPMIKGRDATEPEIDNLMTSKGFEKIGVGTYHHAGEGLLVHDLVPKNAKVSSSTGKVHVIDPVIQRVTPAFAADLKANPISSMLMASVRDDLGRLIFFSAGGSGVDEQPSPLDPIISARVAALAAAYHGSMAPFRQAILSSESRESCLKRLTLLYADWDPARLVNEMDHALQLCSATAAHDSHPSHPSPS